MPGTVQGTIREQIIITGDDQSKKAIEAAIVNIGKLQAKGDLGAIISSQGKVVGGFEEMSNQLKATAAKFVAFGVAAAAAVAAAKRIGEAISEAARFGDQLDVLESKYGDLSDTISGAQAAAGGTISKKELVALSQGLDLFGIGIDKVDRIAEALAKTAVRTGKDVSEMGEKFALAIGKESFLRLDDFGILIKDSTRVMADYAATIGKTSEQLTEQERKVALLAESLKQMESNNVDVDLAKSRTAVIARMSTAWDDLSTAVTTAGIAFASFSFGHGSAIDQVIKKAEEFQEAQRKNFAAQLATLTPSERSKIENAIASAVQAGVEAGFIDAAGNIGADFGPFQTDAEKNKAPKKPKGRKRRDTIAEEAEAFLVEGHDDFFKERMKAAEKARALAESLRQDEADMEEELFLQRIDVEQEFMNERIRIQTEAAETIKAINADFWETTVTQTADALALLGESLEGEDGAGIFAGIGKGIQTSFTLMDGLSEKFKVLDKAVAANQISDEKASKAKATAAIEVAGAVGRSITSQIKDKKLQAGIDAAIATAQGIGYVISEQYDKAALSFAMAGLLAAVAGTSSSGKKGAGGGTVGGALAPARQSADNDNEPQSLRIENNFFVAPGASVGSPTQEAGQAIGEVMLEAEGTGFNAAGGGI